MATFRRVGRLKHRVTLQQRSAQFDSLGRQQRGQEQWVTVDRLWSEVLELSGREAEIARQTVSDATHAVTIRFRSGVSSEQRLLYRGRVLEIKAVTDGDNSRRELLLVCGELK
jgi:SPP1 family predicted phage head-tail adaptor